jgi:MOSC domain-containing protein YiiM
VAGKIEHLFVKPAHGSPMREVREARAVEGKGLEGDLSFGRGARQVLLMEAETLERFGLEPGLARENLLVRGFRLADVAVGTHLAAGEAVLEVTGDCSPCSFMDELQPGLQEAIRGERGMLARVVRGGRIRIGDPVAISPPAEPLAGP